MLLPAIIYIQTVTDIAKYMKESLLSVMQQNYCPIYFF